MVSKRVNPNVSPYNPETGSTPEPEGFDVTCIIGRVIIGGGELTEREAAFQLIARHKAPGVFSFPMEHGGFERITVEFIEPQPSDAERESIEFFSGNHNDEAC